MKTSRMAMSGFSSAIFFNAAAPLLTAMMSYPASVRIFLPMFWAVMLSSASRIFSATEVPLILLHEKAGRRVWKLTVKWLVSQCGRHLSGNEIGRGRTGRRAPSQAVALKRDHLAEEPFFLLLAGGLVLFVGAGLVLFLLLVGRGRLVLVAGRTLGRVGLRCFRLGRVVHLRGSRQGGLGLGGRRRLVLVGC